jgi:hypothetical protein
VDAVNEHVTEIVADVHNVYLVCESNIRRYRFTDETMSAIEYSGSRATGDFSSVVISSHAPTIFAIEFGREEDEDGEYTTSDVVALDSRTLERRFSIPRSYFGPLTYHRCGPYRLVMVEDELYVYDMGPGYGSRFQVFSLDGVHHRSVWDQDLSHLRCCKIAYAHARLYVCEIDHTGKGCVCVLTVEGATVQIYEIPNEGLKSAVIDSGSETRQRSLRFQVLGGV